MNSRAVFDEFVFADGVVDRPAIEAAALQVKEEMTSTEHRIANEALLKKTELREKRIWGSRPS